MEITIEAQHRRYLTHKVRTGEFGSPSDVVNFALNRLQKDERDIAWLKRELQKGIDSLERGEVTPWNVEEEKARLLRRLKRQRRKA